MRPQGATYLSRPQMYGGFGGSAPPSGQLPYGSAPALDPKAAAAFESAVLFNRWQRQRLNVVPMFQCLLLPWLFFCGTYALLSFELRYRSPGACWALVGLCSLVTLTCGMFALHGLWRRLRGGAQGDAPTLRPPSWMAFLAVSTFAALVLGVLLGDLNYKTNMQQYYDYVNLNEHAAIDPARMRGQEFMDAGRVYFTNASALDLRKAMGFRNLDTYCVAPITTMSSAGTLLALESYDFWAVGLGCCQTHPHMADFQCGEFANPSAHQGLRLLRDDQRDFFRLAVQQAEATYSLKATHPLFFFWVGDATAEMRSFHDAGYKYFFIGVLVHFAWQALCVALAAAAFAKLGKL